MLQQTLISNLHPSLSVSPYGIGLRYEITWQAISMLADHIYFFQTFRVWLRGGQEGNMHEFFSFNQSHSVLNWDLRAVAFCIHRLSQHHV